MAEGDYKVVRGDGRDDRERILALWQRCGFSAGEEASARYDWFYFGNPRGPGRVYLLTHCGELVGSLGAGTRWFLPGPARTPLRAAILVDFVVHPSHRTMFPAMLLQRVAREQEMQDVDLVYGLPEAKAAPIFKRLGATQQLTSGSHVRVIRSANYARRHLPRAPGLPVRMLCWVADRARLLSHWFNGHSRGLRARWHDSLPAELGAFWERYLPGEALGTGERHLAFLKWRFQEQSRQELRFLTLHNRGAGSLAAYFICRFEGADLKVVDFLIDEREHGRSAAFIGLAMASWPLGVESVRVTFGGCPETQCALDRAGFVLRDQRPCFIMKATGDRALPQQWWLTKADEDI